MESDAQSSFTGRARRRKTRWTVRWIDRAAGALIAVGGIGTIVAVSLVCVFLIWTVLPLFQPAELGPPRDAPLAASGDAPLKVGLDEYQAVGWAILADGQVRAFRADTGAELETARLFAGPAPTAWTFGVSSEEIACGFADGTFRRCRVGFDTQVVEAESQPELAEFGELKPGEIAQLGPRIITRLPEGGFRVQRLAVTAEEPVKSGDSSPIIALDYVPRSNGPVYGTVSQDGTIRLLTVTERKNLLTGKTTQKSEASILPWKPSPGEEPPRRILVSGLGDNVFVAWDDGRLLRFDTRNPDAAQLVEDLDLAPEPEARLTALQFVIGRATLVSGDSQGAVRTWFTTKPDDAETADGMTLLLAHDLSRPGAAVTAITSSTRSRIIAVGFADGQVHVNHLTSEKLLVDTRLSAAESVRSLVISPKQDGLLALGDGTLRGWRLDARHPEATFHALFRPVLYEGFGQPKHTWQSTASTDEPEPKFGLMPLVYGTVKATFYSMLFGAPLALMAAVFTSEFLTPRVKARVKPTVEMMASLPSVVLGFLAGLVIAPFVEGVVPAILTSLVAVPLCILLGAHVWQVLPQAITLRCERWRLAFVALAAAPGVSLATWLGPSVERLLFAGDIRTWLADRSVGNGTGGWLLLFLPLAAVAVAWAVAAVVNPWLRQTTHGWSRNGMAWLSLGKFLSGGVVALFVAWGLAAVLTACDLDPRGSYIATYVQRNALVVGFVMGFAVIPIIYTIAEDALSTVPDHLRAASLGAGATPWQTALRVVMPTAMSGLFSALMVGLGRAVGETMIVLMAAGNTSIMEWNIFNGFQTLSALIATELPEAAAGSTHYRVLFLAALVLFVMTFILNTVAEVVRQRFRKRAFQL